MEETFDPNKINFDLEMNELILRMTSLKRAIDDISVAKNFTQEKKLEIIFNLQSEYHHIEKIIEMVFPQKGN